MITWFRLWQLGDASHSPFLHNYKKSILHLDFLNIKKFTLKATKFIHNNVIYFERNVEEKFKISYNSYSQPPTIIPLLKEKATIFSGESEHVKERT